MKRPFSLLFICLKGSGKIVGGGRGSAVPVAVDRALGLGTDVAEDVNQPLKIRLVQPRMSRKRHQFADE